MVVGFNVNTDDFAWNGNFTPLFDALATNQGELVKAGVTGVIYSPARGPAGTTSYQGLVQMEFHMYVPDAKGVHYWTTVGRKTPKFCAFQDAMQKMTASPPVAIFNRIPAQAVTCVACTPLDYLAGGRCSPSNPVPQMNCDDGHPCTIPVDQTTQLPTMTAAQARCPDGAVTDQCTPCSSVSGRTYTCTYQYSDGTRATVGPNSISDLANDAYSDVVAGLPRPNKCCIVDPTSNTTYSYSKQAYASPLSKPVVFPGIGDANVDCGMGGDTGQLNTISNFCGYNLPLKQYDINCSVN
jgi:hypothetical protein